MALYDLKGGALTKVPETSFVSEELWERRDLQKALRENIDVLGEDLLVVAEEFAGFAGANRRIDLLCVDHDARVVVVELKRTQDGGHMELQALRYAAMVSTMTFEDLTDIFERNAFEAGDDSTGGAREVLAGWFEDVGGEDAVVSREVRVVLASSGFDKEITTTVLWLNDVFGMDIRCVRLSLYKSQERVLLDVQPLIPLPEARDLTIKLKKRQTAARVSSDSSKDYTKYIVRSPAGDTAALPKRRAVLALVHALHDGGVSGTEMAAVLQHGKFLSVGGVVSGTQLEEMFVAQYQKAQTNLHRWFIDQPIHDAEATWVLSNQWAGRSVAAMEALIALRPGAGYSIESA